MAITDTYDKLVELAANTDGITSAPPEPPAQITDDMLPCVVTRAGPAEWNEHASGLRRQVRTYTQDCFVRPVAQGDYLKGYYACLTPLYNLGRTYIEDTTLGGTVDMMGNRGDFTDSGVRVLEWVGNEYHGFTLILRVTEKST